jgi:hypothetical protein
MGFTPPGKPVGVYEYGVASARVWTPPVSVLNARNLK